MPVLRILLFGSGLSVEASASLHNTIQPPALSKIRHATSMLPRRSCTAQLKSTGPVSFVPKLQRHIAKFWECMDATELLCTILIGNHCDCSRGKSSVSFNNGLTVKCVMSKTADLSGGFGFSAKPGEMFGGKSKNGKLQLPTGKEIKQEFRDMTKKLKKDARKALKPRTSQAPTGTCETSMDLAVDGLMQAALTIEMSTKGSITTMGISGTVRVSLDGLVKAQGSCSLNAEKWFPEKPKKKVICYKGFCIILLLQGVAELEVNGVLTGTLDLGADVDFDISGSVTVDKTTGHAEAKFETPKIKRQARGAWKRFTEGC